MGVWHREEAESCDAVDEPGGGSGPHLAPPHHRRLVRAPGVKDDVLGAQRLVGSWQGVVGCSTEGLSDITVRFGLPAEQLTSSLPEQLGKFVFGWRLKRAQEEEETAVEEWWELPEMIREGKKEHL